MNTFFGLSSFAIANQNWLFTRNSRRWARDTVRVGRLCQGLRTEESENKNLAPKAKVLRCRRRHALRGGGRWHVRGGGASVGGGGWNTPGGFDFGPSLVDGRQGGVASMEGWGEPKVSLVAKPLELQYYFASKAASKNFFCCLHVCQLDSRL